MSLASATKILGESHAFEICAPMVLPERRVGHQLTCISSLSTCARSLFLSTKQNKPTGKKKNETKSWQKVKKSSRFEAVGRVVVEVLPHLRVDVLTYIQYFNIRKIQVTDSILND